MRVLGDERFELGEGARWVDGRLVFVDLLAGRLLEARGDAPPVEVLRMPMPLGAVAPVPGKEGWVAAAGTGLWSLAPTTEPRPLVDLGVDPVTTRVNDAVADPAGRMWIGTMTYAATPGTGRLHRWHPSTGHAVVLDGLTIPNGPAFDATGTVLYLADSALGHIDRLTVDASGDVADRRPFARIDPADGSPDGMTVDVAGNLWVALWGGSAVRRYRPDGTLDVHLPVGARQPTSVCLGGPDLRTLFITTAGYGLREPGGADGALLVATVDVAGRPACPGAVGSALSP
ncbi:calcium-binding protein [Longispora fulva]|uniref:Sugar lactone lactonase YvrE n=1 Tax=Longispora fulva TaxID=619741 RepID=A0A8J7KDB0_9ACTN|nr:SMP-30/gluconolactonase/LRE family protein [Longispora fulva]MBG6133860.1 sugar lactone lactonase YvrE [Longispora fulva]GIG62900.1 calcium-binding protein [Longispora fulva]